MRKIIVLLIAVLLSATSYSQTDSTVKDTSESKLSGLIIVGSKSLWRGIDFGNGSPTIQGLVTYSPFKFLDINVLGITSLNGTTAGYSNTLNIFLTFKYKNFYLEVDDYYFKGDQTNLPTNYWHHNKTHFVESRVGLKNDRWDVKAGYTIYGGDLYSNPIIDTLGNTLDNTHGVYLEANFRVTDEFTMFMGGITAPSALNFTDKAGITNIGVKYNRVVNISDKFSVPVETILVVNPNYDNISPAGLPRIGYGSSPVNFVINLYF